MEINRVGIIGAGQMGNGIAHVFALSGFDVILHDNSEVALSRALSVIDGNLERQVSKGRISPDDKKSALERIRVTPELAGTGDSELVIEAATEREEIKSAIFEELVPHLRPETILTSNTSSISITRLGFPDGPA